VVRLINSTHIYSFTMTRWITPLALLLLCAAQTLAQTPVHRDIARLKEEKLRGYDLEAARQWMLAHPGQPVPKSVLTPTPKAIERAAEVVVSGNAEAESEVHAAINPTDSNNIITAAIIQDPNAIDNPLDVPIRYTTNFGQTWSTSNIEFSPNAGLFSIAAGGGDPVIAFDKSGKAYLTWLVLTLDLLNDPPVKLAMYASSSTNKGQTWSAPLLVDFGTISIEGINGEGTGTLVDKQWMACDQSNSTHEGNLYVTYTRFEIIDSLNSGAKILCKRKLKTANAFSTNAVQVHDNSYEFMQFSSVDVDGDGDVHVLFYAGNTASGLALYHTVSTNGGVSFEPETIITPLQMNGFLDTLPAIEISGLDADRIYPCPHLRAGKESGLLYATWSSAGLATPSGEGYDVWFTKSTDNGTTWATPRRINAGTNDAAHQFYPALAVSSTGVVALSYYDRTEAPTGTNTHYVLTYSLDEGATFSAPVNMTTEASDFEFIGSVNGGFGIGEYTQVVCAPNTAIPVWSDGRSNNGDIDIYAAFATIGTGPSSVQQIGTLTDAFAVTAPNPAAGGLPLQITLRSASTVKIEVFGMDGRVVYQDAPPAVRPTGSFDVQIPLTPGQYVCRVETRHGWKALKIVVQ
jgi:hypothetical protein